MIQFSLITKKGGILTKRFYLQNGELIKDSKQCFLERGSIETIEIEFKDLPEFLDGIESNQAIVHGIAVQSPCDLVAKRLLKKNPGAIARVKENFFWADEGIIMFDYDPPAEDAMNKEDLIKAIRSLHPELEKAAMVWRPSASSNIIGEDGEVHRGLKNQRIYVEYRNPEGMDAFISNLEKRSWDKGHGYIFITAAGTGLPRCLFDMAVFSSERLDFAAGGVCEKGLKPQTIHSTYHGGDVVDFDEIGYVPDGNRFTMQVDEARREVKTSIGEVREKYKEAQAEKLMHIQGISKPKAKKIVKARLRNKLLPKDVVFANDMTPIPIADIILDQKRYHGMVIRDPLEPDYGEGKAKIFADDDGIVVNSFAHGGRVFVVQFDRETYLQLLESIEDNELLLETWTDKIGNFSGSSADKEMIAKEVSHRTGVPKAVLLKDMKDTERTVKEENQEEIEDLSHHQIAQRLLAKLPRHIVATEGKVFSYNGANCWKGQGLNEIELQVASHFDCLPKCSRRTDYNQISKHLYNMIEDPPFFSSGNPVIATKDACWMLNSNGIVVKRSHDPKHRVRFILPFETVPMDTPMPLMKGFCTWAFGRWDDPQVLLLQEIFGAVIFGVLTRQWHRAILFRGSGGNGKSVVADILSGMVPGPYVSHISPFQFGEPVYVGQLSGKLLNVATELEKGQRLPGAVFKQVIDSSTLMGKPLYQQPFEFPSTAAHVFSSNYPLYTTDGSAGMQRRWLMLWFGNTVSDSQKIPEFGKVIVDSEGPQLFNWAMEGVERLYKNKGFTKTERHQSLAAEMFMDTDPLSSFIMDEDVIVFDKSANSKLKALRAGVYTKYREWHKHTGQNPRGLMTKTRFNSKMEERGFSTVKTGGKVHWKGIELAM